MVLILVFIASPVNSQIVVGRLRAPFDPIEHVTEVSTTATYQDIMPTSLIIKILFGLYQRGVGPTKGTHCPMIPSCSEYGRICIAKHGLPLGIMMAADRLHRCGHDLNLYQRLWSVSQGWCYDDPPR